MVWNGTLVWDCGTIAYHRRHLFSFFLAALKITTVTIAMIKMFTCDHMQED